MPRAAADDVPRFDLVRKTEGRCKPRRTDARKLVCKMRRKNENRPRHAPVTKLFAFPDCCHAVAPRLERFERTEHRFDAQSVSIGLDHRQQRYARATRKSGSITLQRAQVDLDPGAR